MDAKDMHGIVLCAGLGTRLRPLTSAIPKPAVPVGSVPAALRNIEQLLSAGFTTVHCNTHYLAVALENELRAACRSRGITQERLRFWNETEILETGGGIARIARDLCSESGASEVRDTLVVSGDIVADIPTSRMLDAWSKRTPQQTSLMVSLPLDRPRKDVTWVSLAHGRVVGFGGDFSPNDAIDLNLTARVFSNHQIISGAVLERADVVKKSSIDLFYRSALGCSEEILHLPMSEGAHWFDIGTPESYFNCLRQLKHPRPAWLGHNSLGKIHLCIADPNLETLCENPTDKKTSQSQAISDSTKFAWNCLSNPDQVIDWNWLGTLHELPEILLSGLVGLIETLEIQSGGKPARVSGKMVRLYLKTMNGGLLAPIASSLAHHPQAGFIDTLVPSSLSAHPLFVRPLLVPFDFLLPQSQNPSHEESPFSLLFIPQPR